MTVDEQKLKDLYGLYLFREPDNNAQGYMGQPEDYVKNELLNSQERSWIRQIIELARRF